MKQVSEEIKNKKWIKILDQDGNSIHGGSMKWSLPNGKEGDWHEVKGAISCCSNGLHFTCDPKVWIKPNSRFFLSELDFSDYSFESNENDNKICVRRARLTQELTKEQLYEYGIYLGGTHILKNGIFYVGGNATVKASGNATVEAWGNATVEASGNATVKAWDNATVKASGNATVEAWGNATVEAWGNATVKASGNATVEASGNATVKASGNAYLLFFNNNSKHTITDCAVMKDYYSHKIFIKKSSHEIVEIE